MLTQSPIANLRQNLLRGGVGEETIDVCTQLHSVCILCHPVWCFACRSGEKKDLLLLTYTFHQLLSQDDATIEREAPPPTTHTPVEVHNYGPSFEGPSFADDHVQIPRGLPRSYGGYNAELRSHNQQKHHHIQHHAHTQEASDWADDADEEDSAADAGHIGDPHSQDFAEPSAVSQANGRPFYERQCARSILLSNLADGTTHADITQAIRGGQLIDIYLRPHDRTATVSFLLSADARAFLNNVRRHDLYVRQKRVRTSDYPFLASNPIADINQVDARWSDRHFILPGHVASKIGIGATRNLVIRRCDPRLTEAALREDLDHIHNLIVVKVEFAGSSCYIKTNSVHNAMFARTCMMSRLWVVCLQLAMVDG